MKINTYLFFNGNCEEAFKFYAQSLGGKVDSLMRHTGTPAEKQVPAEWREKIMHARLSVGDNILMGSDAPPEHFKTPQGFSVSITIDDVNTAERTFNALAKDGKITMPIQETFWAVRFGMLVDRFGIAWMINHEKKTT